MYSRQMFLYQLVEVTVLAKSPCQKSLTHLAFILWAETCHVFLLLLGNDF